MIKRILLPMLPLLILPFEGLPVAARIILPTLSHVIPNRFSMCRFQCLLSNIVFRVCVLLLLSASGHAATLVDNGDEQVSLIGPGRLRITNDSGAHIELQLTTWRDDWVYRPLARGRKARTRIRPGRMIEQSGGWGDFAEALPIDYRFNVASAPAFIDLDLELVATAPVQLTSGIWASLKFFGDSQIKGRRIALQPGASGKLGRTLADFSEQIEVELGNGRAMILELPGPGLVRSEPGERGLVVTAKLMDHQLAVGEPWKSRLRVRFKDGLADPPDRIEPQNQRLRIRDTELYVNGEPVQVERGRPVIVKQYDQLEWRTSITGTYSNPYDPDQILLSASVSGASGSYAIPGFYMIDYDREIRDGIEIWKPETRTDKRWRVRLTATRAGPLVTELSVINGDDIAETILPSVVVMPGDDRGFVRTSRIDSHYFQYDNGEGCFLIGHNLPIYNNIGENPRAVLERMAANGENCCRLWMSSDSLGIEWEDRVGWYRQESAARLDYVLACAGQLGIKVMLCLDTHQDFDGVRWQDNPYNVVNGGACSKPSEWFTSEIARKQYRKRLRYIVARWGHAKSLLCWEFGNEFEGWPDSAEDIVISWHRKMAPVLKALDPYDHLVSTSWWTHMGPESCWRLPEIDIVQTHCYTNNDFNVAEPVKNYTNAQWLYYDKPHMFSEFGVDSRGPPLTTDSLGWSLHNAMWASVSSGGASTAMPWWHSSYIDPLNLYERFKVVRSFVDDLPFGTATWQPLPNAHVEFVEKEVPYKDVVILPSTEWGRPSMSNFVVHQSGLVTNESAISEYLHGRDNVALRNPPRFSVDYADRGRLIISIGRVSRSGLLRVSIDNEMVLERKLPAGEGHGVAWNFQPKWNLWHSLYDEDIAIDIPKGRHIIQIANDGRDWMRVKRYVFKDYHKVQPELMVAGLRSDEVGFLWLHNRNNSWHQIWVDAVKPVAPTSVSLAYPAGTYRLEWWNTWRGEVLRQEDVVVTDILKLLPGDLDTDVAVKIRPIN
jgi:hypothetical protein